MIEEFMLNKQQTNDKHDVSYYTILGQHDFLDSDNNPSCHEDSPHVCAKKITNNTKSRFYIKTGIYGKIYNPIGLYSEGTANKMLAKVGKKAWEYKEVNSKVFDMYTSFLRTKNIAWLNNAERELN